MKSAWRKLRDTAIEKLEGRPFRRRLDGKRGRAPADMRIDSWPQLVIDVKAFKRFGHHALMAKLEQRCVRARPWMLLGARVPLSNVPVLITRHEGQRGEYVTVPLDFLAELLDITRGLGLTNTKEG